jgi:hypothetical protein
MKTFVGRVSRGLGTATLPLAAVVLSPSAHANISFISDAGTLLNPESAFQQTFTLSSASTIEVQTWGFGGGVNAAGQTISPGGFDSLVALFSGLATHAPILSGGGNPVADAQNFWSAYLFALPGCPPAGTIAGVCGDNTLKASLTAGIDTHLITDAIFIPIAVNSGSSTPFDLTDTPSNHYGSSTGNGARTDISSGVFQTCASGADCNTDSGNFAVDIMDQSGATVPPTPEPASLMLGARESSCSDCASASGHSIPRHSQFRI